MRRRGHDLVLFRLSCVSILQEGKSCTDSYIGGRCLLQPETTCARVKKAGAKTRFRRLGPFSLDRWKGPSRPDKGRRDAADLRFGGLEPRWREGFCVEGTPTMNDPVTHELGGYGRQKDTVSIMPGGRDQSFRARRTKNRKIVRRAGAQTRPCFKNFRRFQIRAEFHSCFDNPAHSSCCDAFIKADIFQGASDYDAAIGSWNKIAVLRGKKVGQ